MDLKTICNGKVFKSSALLGVLAPVLSTVRIKFSLSNLFCLPWRHFAAQVWEMSLNRWWWPKQSLKKTKKTHIHQATTKHDWPTARVKVISAVLKHDMSQIIFTFSGLWADLRPAGARAWQLGETAAWTFCEHDVHVCGCFNICKCETIYYP